MSEGCRVESRRETKSLGISRRVAPPADTRRHCETRSLKGHVHAVSLPGLYLHSWEVRRAPSHNVARHDAGVACAERRMYSRARLSPPGSPRSRPPSRGEACPIAKKTPRREGGVESFGGLLRASASVRPLPVYRVLAIVAAEATGVAPYACPYNAGYTSSEGLVTAPNC